MKKRIFHIPLEFSVSIVLFEGDGVMIFEKCRTLVNLLLEQNKMVTV
jgi:hypothetical protein